MTVSIPGLTRQSVRVSMRIVIVVDAKGEAPHALTDHSTIGLCVAAGIKSLVLTMVLISLRNSSTTVSDISVSEPPPQFSI